MNGLAKLYLVLTWAFFIFKLISFPVYGEVDTGSGYIDKLIHLILFGVLTYLLIKLLLELKINFWLASVISFLLSSGYAIFTEHIQQFIPGRLYSWYDFGAGIFGSLLAVLFLYYFYNKKPKLLLHVCCMGCGAYIADTLKKNFRLTLYFYNPNIFPQKEYEKRLEETRRIAKKFGLKLIVGEYDHQAWLKTVKGLEKEPERGKRCIVCYQNRLESTAKQCQGLSAQAGTALIRQKYKYFTTTLTISPHKDAKIISRIGQKLAKRYSVEFLDKDFKKQDGFKKSLELSKKLGLYRQDYCGCEFSKR